MGKKANKRRRTQASLTGQDPDSKTNQPSRREHLIGAKQIRLEKHQVAYFSGEGVLKVVHGRLDVWGFTADESSPPLPLHWDAALRGPLMLASRTADVPVPLQHNACSTFAISAQAGSACEVVVRSATEAQCIPIQWQQAVDTVLEAREDGRTVIAAVCGPRGVGKSAFARFLSGALLAQGRGTDRPSGAAHLATDQAVSGSVAERAATRCEGSGVYWLEADAGQPEWHPPGLLSLCKLQGMHCAPQPVQLTSCFFYGDVSPASDPMHFLHGVDFLCQRFRAIDSAWRRSADVQPSHQSDTGAQEQQCPPVLVVNTGGWIKGLGYDTLIEVLQSTQATHVMQLESSTPNKNLPQDRFWEQAHQGEQPYSPRSSVQPPQHVLLPRAPDLPVSNLTASTEGQLSAGIKVKPGCGRRSRLYRMSRMFKGNCLAAALASLVPWEFHLPALHLHSLFHRDLLPSQLPMLVNAAPVGLLVPATTTTAHSNAHIASQGAGQAQVPSGDGGPPSGPVGQRAPRQAGLESAQDWFAQASEQCVGLGIVRGVDRKRNVLHILTDVPEEALQQVCTLVVGRLELPATLLSTAAEELAAAQTEDSSQGTAIANTTATASQRMPRQSPMGSGTGTGGFGSNASTGQLQAKEPDAVPVPQFHCPYLAFHCLQGKGTGSKTIKGRTDLQRLRHVAPV